MNIIYDLYKNLAIKDAIALKTKKSKKTYGDLFDCIKEYDYLIENKLSGYDNKRSYAAIISDSVDIKTIALIFSLLKHNMKVDILSPNIKGELSEMLYNYNYVFSKEKVYDFDNTINYYKYHDEILFGCGYNLDNLTDGDITIYKKDIYGQLLCEDIYLKDLDEYKNHLSEVKLGKKWQEVISTLKLTDKNNLVLLLVSLSSGMEVTHLDCYEMEKNISEIIKRKSKIVTFDKFLILELYLNISRPIDLSFIEEIIIDFTLDEYMEMFGYIIKDYNIKASIINKENKKVLEK